MKCLIYFLISDFAKFSPDTLKMADILHYGVLCEQGVIVHYQQHPSPVQMM